MDTLRITSYNVCYTKLLRNIEHIKKLIYNISNNKIVVSKKEILKTMNYIIV